MPTPDPTNGARSARDGLALGLLLLPSFLVVLAAAERPARLPVLVVIVVGLLVALRSPELRSRAAWAAPLPAAVILVCALVPEPTALIGSAGCSDPAPTRAVRRVLEMSVVLVATLVAWRVTGLPGASLLLRRPSAAVALLSVAGFVVATVGAVLLGPVLAEPFFGPIVLRVPPLVALVPLVVAALANAVQEEVAYRGAWLGWGGLAIGPVGGARRAGPRVRARPHRERLHRAPAPRRRGDGRRRDRGRAHRARDAEPRAADRDPCGRGRPDGDLLDLRARSVTPPPRIARRSMA